MDDTTPPCYYGGRLGDRLDVCPVDQLVATDRALDGRQGVAGGWRDRMYLDLVHGNVASLVMGADDVARVDLAGLHGRPRGSGVVRFG